MKQKQVYLKPEQQRALQRSYRSGDNLDFYFDNKSQSLWSIIMGFIREDLGGNPNDEDCEIELRRLCEPSVRHYYDCACAICR